VRRSVGNLGKPWMVIYISLLHQGLLGLQKTACCSIRAPWSR
jgi:hypothetical protein